MDREACEVRWGGQARLPRHVFAPVVRRMMGSGATARSGSISSSTRQPAAWVMPIVELAAWSCPSLTRRLLGRREAADLAVAQAVVDEREDLAGERDACLVHAAPLRDVAILRVEVRAAVVAADPLDQRPAHQPRPCLEIRPRRVLISDS